MKLLAAPGAAAFRFFWPRCFSSAARRRPNASAPQPPPASGVIPDAPELAALGRARQTVEKFFEQAANVVCAENVTQAMVGKNGRPTTAKNPFSITSCRANPNSGSLKLVESREQQRKAASAIPRAPC